MQWLGRRESDNVDDRRGISGGAVAGGGGIIGIIVYLLYSFLGGDPNNAPQMQAPTEQAAPLSADEQAKDDQRAKFVKVVLADTEDIWGKILPEQTGKQYTDPTLVLFRDGVTSACGNASSASGPFYCPGDGKLYIDLSFYQEMQDQLNAPGDFAMAYVIAHEVGHHIQDLLGVSDKVQNLRRSQDETEANHTSVQLELQADFYAGVWAHYDQKMKNVLDAGDIDEALNAANQIGDDMLQKKSTGQVVPDAFTHGTSAQRVYWFKKGFETGDMKQGDTFNDPSLR